MAGRAARVICFALHGRYPHSPVCRCRCARSGKLRPEYPFSAPGDGIGTGSTEIYGILEPAQRKLLYSF
jgi:hypothetical protein